MTAAATSPRHPSRGLEEFIGTLRTLGRGAADGPLRSERAADEVLTALAAGRTNLDAVEATIDWLVSWAEERPLSAEDAAPLVEFPCDMIRLSLAPLDVPREDPNDPLWPTVEAEFTTAAYRMAAVVRTMGVTWPGLVSSVPADVAAFVWTVRLPPWAYLRAMWNLFWSAIRHPLSQTTIDLTTGRVLYRT